MTFDLAGNPKWVKLNVNMTGYYRVCYSDADWDALIDQLLEDHTVSALVQYSGKSHALIQYS